MTGLVKTSLGLKREKRGKEVQRKQRRVGGKELVDVKISWGRIERERNINGPFYFSGAQQQCIAQFHFKPTKLH